MPLLRHSHPDDAPCEYWISGIEHSTVAYTSGISPEPRPELPGYNSGILCIVMAMLIAVIFNLRRYRRFFRSLLQDLWSIRLRTNLFDEHTVNETRIVVTLVAQTCICEALLIVAWMLYGGYRSPSSDLIASVGIMTAITVGYYMFQLIAYRTVAYAFTSHILAIQWMRGFNATQTLLGMVLVLPTLILLFFPVASGVLIPIAAILYIIARVVFIGKGFRIFYHNSFSLIYFILYLCTLEIIPLIIIYRAVISISDNFLS